MEKFGCNCCQPLMINNVFCHETGCPNSRRNWNEETGEWDDEDDGLDDEYDIWEDEDD